MSDETRILTFPETNKAKAAIGDVAAHLDDFETVVIVAVRSDTDSAKIIVAGCGHVHHVLGAFEDAKLIYYSCVMNGELEAS